MTNKSSTTDNTSGNAAFSNGSGLPDISAFMTAPGLVLGQRLALHTARFWAKRMRACASQIEWFATCDNPVSLMDVQMKFIKQMQDDYAAESEAVNDITSAVMALSPNAERWEQTQH